MKNGREKGVRKHIGFEAGACFIGICYRGRRGSDNRRGLNSLALIKGSLERKEGDRSSQFCLLLVNG